MPQITGPQLDRLQARALEWYFQTRARLIAVLEQDYPYGSIKLTPEEQYSRFIQLDPQGWQQLLDGLYARYRGLPNAQLKVSEDIARYVTEMMQLGLKVETLRPSRTFPPQVR